MQNHPAVQFAFQLVAQVGTVDKVARLRFDAVVLRHAQQDFVVFRIITAHTDQRLEQQTQLIAHQC